MSTELKSFGTLFTETWEQFKNRALTIFGVLLVSTLVVFGLVVVLAVVFALSVDSLQGVVEQFQQGRFDLQFLLLSCLFLLVVVVAGMWSQSATIAVVIDETMGVREALRAGWQRLRAMGWILLLAGSIVITGFLLFMVPGIIFSISLMFALYPLYEDDLRGMDAIMASRRYVKGRWWNTCGKLLLVWLIAIVFDLIPLVGPFLYFVFTPFLLLFMVAMYRDLKATAGESTAVERRSGWWLLAVIGMILPVVGIGAALVTLGPQLPALLQEAGELTQQPMPTGMPPVESPLQNQDTDIPVIPEAGQSIWRDPVGDVAEFGVGRWMDIEAVFVKSDAGTLLVDVQTSFPLTVAFNAASTTAQSLYRLSELYFDTDIDRRTGGPAGKDTGRPGYDFGLDITLEAPRNEPEKGQVHVGLFRFENGVRRFLGPLPEEQVQVQGNHIRLRLGYDLLGVQTGERLRMSFIETFQQQGSGLSKDKIIDL